MRIELESKSDDAYIFLYTSSFCTNKTLLTSTLETPMAVLPGDKSAEHVACAWHMHMCVPVFPSISCSSGTTFGTGTARQPRKKKKDEKETEITKEMWRTSDYIYTYCLEYFMVSAANPPKGHPTIGGAAEVSKKFLRS